MEERQSIDDSQEAKLKLMTESPVERLVCKLAVPTIITMTISAMYNMADTYFVGGLGTSATAAVGVSFSLMAIIQAVGFFFGHGSGNYISRRLGAHDFTEASKMAATGFCSAMIAGILIAALGLVFLNPLTRALGATDTILPFAVDYLRYILIGTPWMTCSLMLNNLLRFQGSAAYGMVGMTAGAVLNIALDPLFIYVFDMGVGGAGLATMLSQFVGFVVLLIGCNRGGNIKVHLKNFSPSPHAYKEMIRGGAPSLFRQSLSSVATICLNHVAGGYGDMAIAAMSIVTRITMFANSALIGFGQGFQPVCGINYGAKLYDRVKKAFWFCVKASFAVLVAITIAGVVFAPAIIAVFRRDDPEVIRIGALALRLQCLTFPFLGFVTLSNMLMQTIGKAAKSSFLAIARQGLFFLPILFVSTAISGIFGVQISQPLADAATLIVTIPVVRSVLLEMQMPPKLDIPAQPLA